jgi:hypothetical protein
MENYFGNEIHYWISRLKCSKKTNSLYRQNIMLIKLISSKRPKIINLKSVSKEIPFVLIFIKFDSIAIFAKWSSYLHASKNFT